MDEVMLEDKRWLALAYHHMRRLLRADGQVSPSEFAFLSEHEVSHQAVRMGLVANDTTLTPAGVHALGDALLTCNELLSRQQKLGLVSFWFRAAVADGDFASTEGKALMQAARWLGIDEQDVHEHLDQHGQLGTLDLPAPESDA